MGGGPPTFTPTPFPRLIPRWWVVGGGGWVVIPLGGGWVVTFDPPGAVVSPLVRNIVVVVIPSGWNRLQVVMVVVVG